MDEETAQVKLKLTAFFIQHIEFEYSQCQIINI